MTGSFSHAVRLMLLTTFAAQVCLTVAGFEATYLIWGLLSTRFSVEDRMLRQGN
jgi:putative peptidoglycan lipid II flippase